MIENEIPEAAEALTKHGALLAVVYQGLDEATLYVRDFFATEQKPIDANVAATLVRWRMKLYLDARGHQSVAEDDEPGEYERECLGNNGLAVVSQGTHFRILRANRGWLPAAGDSRVSSAR